jgi:hypothetical protein
MILTLRPNSDFLTQCATFGAGVWHYGRINEVTADDANGIRSNTTMRRDTFGLPLASATGVISSVTIKARASGYYVAGYTKIQLGLWVNKAFPHRKSVTELPYGVTIYSGEWLVNPQTSAVWTWENINNLYMEIGLEGAVDSKGTGDMFAQCFQAWLEVEYESPPSANKVPLHLFFQGVK